MRLRRRVRSERQALLAWVFGGAAVVITISACDAGETRTDADPSPDPARLSQEEVDRLRAIGYVGFTDSQVDPDAPPIRHHDAARSQPGYNTVANRDLASVEIVDAEGRTLHRWHDPAARHWSNAELLPEGDLLVPGSMRDKSGNFLLRMSWSGKTRWRQMVNAHHDVERRPDGRISTLLFRLRRIPEIDPAIDVKDHEIALLDGEGNLLERRSLYDLLTSNPDEFRFLPVQAKPEKRPFIDLLHANSLEWMHQPHLEARSALYAPTNVLVSFRHQDTVAIFDWEANELVWAWGQGEISGQHDATVLPNGNILIFDNGLDRGASRIVELDPLQKEIVWEYEAAEPKDFFSLRKGSSQRLANGNTLIANSDSGDAFEVTPAGEMVWHYVNPRADEHGNRATIVRIKRYPTELIDPLLRLDGTWTSD